MKRFLTILTLVSMVLFSQVGVNKAYAVQLSCGAAGATSWVYSCVTAVSEILKQHSDIDLVVQSTPGSTVHYGMMASGELKMGSGYNPTDYWAWNGIGALFPKSYKGEFYTMIPLARSYFYVIVKKDSPITKIADLKGKRVFVGDPGSAQAAGTQDVIKALSLEMDQIMTDRDEGFEMLKDGRVEALMYGGAAPYSSILAVASDIDIRFIPMTGEEQKSITEVAPYYFAGAIPKDSYDFLDGDIDTVCTYQNIVVSKALDSEIVYTMTKTLVEHWKELNSIVAGTSDIDPLVNINNSVVPIHPGAIKYYEEKGITIVPTLHP